MDLQTGWDFSRQEDKDRAWKYVEEEKPKLLIGSLMCTIFSVLQNLNQDSPERRCLLKEGLELLAFCSTGCSPRLSTGIVLGFLSAWLPAV